MSTFPSKVISWYRSNKRDLPWRQTQSPYLIWLSEIILQQTRVDQGLPYYERFVEKFPTINQLASASEEEVLRLWQGLGYYSRGRNLHFTAKYIVEELDGKFPAQFAELKKLKGVGDYTAAAIASFCFGEAVPVVDGNVYRVLSRFEGISIPIDSPSGKKYFFALAQDYIKQADPAEFNQAIMEFGALQCVPKSPNCAICPVSDHCFAYRKAEVKQFPVKSKKIKRSKRYFIYLVDQQKNKFALQKRDNSNIWAGLYEFPSIELAESPELITQDALRMELAEKIYGSENVLLEKLNFEKHVLTHQDIFYTFLKARIREKDQEEFSYFTTSEISRLPLPKIMENYFKNL